MVVAFGSVVASFAVLGLIAACLVVVSCVGLWRGHWRLARVAMPPAAVIVALIGATDAWSRLAVLLLLVLVAAAITLAYAGGDGAAGWNLLALFCVGAVVCGYGLLGRFLCTDPLLPCTAARVARTAVDGGGAIALTAFALLYLRAGQAASRRDQQ